MKKTLDRLAKLSAIAAGVVVVVITLITTGSIVGRWLFSSPLLGDTEMVEYAMAVVVAGCLPLAQWRSANIIVDFFTSGASAATRRRLDRIGALLVGAMMALISWRTVVGAIDQKGSGSVTMLLQWPEWIAYAIMCVPLALTAVIAFYMAATGQSGADPVPAARDAVPHSPLRQER